MKINRFYGLMMIIGTVVPWLFFGHFFFENGVNILLFAQSLFANAAASGFTADILISIFIFWCWSFLDAKKHHIQHWWLVLPAGCFVGLSLALPLYLYLRSALKDE